MVKKIGVLIFLIVCLIGSSYLRKPQRNDIIDNVFFDKIVLSDIKGTLIPVSINFENELSFEESFYNKFDLMQSKVFVEDGLYPSIDEELNVLSVDEKDDKVIIDFDESINQLSNPMKFLEVLTFITLKENEKLIIQRNGETLSELPQTHYPLDSLTSQLGLNNFVDFSAILNHTIPLTYYKKEIIKNKDYYVPYVLRVDEKIPLNDQIETLLKCVNAKIHVLNVFEDNNVLNIELSPNILLDNELIDNSLEDIICLSVLSLKKGDKVRLLINDEEIGQKSVTKLIYNQLKV